MGKKFFYAVILTGILFVNCAPREHLKPILPKPKIGYPFTAVGLIQTSEAYGSGVLVGKNLVLTAAHVVCDNEGNIIKGPIWFYPNFGNYPGQWKEDLFRAKAIKIAKGEWKYKKGYYSEENDWAVLRIDKKFGKIFGYVDVRVITPFDINKKKPKFLMAGYASRNGSCSFKVKNKDGIDYWHANKLGITRNVRFHKVEKDTGAYLFKIPKIYRGEYSGHSGGPLFVFGLSGGKYYVAGIFVASIIAEYYIKVVTPAILFYPTVIKMRKER